MHLFRCCIFHDISELYFDGGWITSTSTEQVRMSLTTGCGGKKLEKTSSLFAGNEMVALFLLPGVQEEEQKSVEIEFFSFFVIRGSPSGSTVANPWFGSRDVIGEWAVITNEICHHRKGVLAYRKGRRHDVGFDSVWNANQFRTLFRVYRFRFVLSLIFWSTISRYGCSISPWWSFSIRTSSFEVQKFNFIFYMTKCGILWIPLGDRTYYVISWSNKNYKQMSKGMYTQS